MPKSVDIEERDDTLVEGDRESSWRRGERGELNLLWV